MTECKMEGVLHSIFDSKDASWKPSDKIPLVIKEIDELKSDMKCYLSNSDDDISGIVRESQELCEESSSLVEEMRKCKVEIEEETMAEILKSIESRNLLAKELQSVNFAMSLVGNVMQCGKYMKEFNEGREARSFTRAVQAIYDLLVYLETCDVEFQSLDLYCDTKITAQMILDSLLNDLFSEWDGMISWNTKPGTRKTVATMTLKMAASQATIDFLNALDKCKKLNEKVNEFAQFLLHDALIPIITNDCTVFSETEELVIITINHSKNIKPHYDEVISNLRLLLHHLSNKLNIEYSEDNTIMQMIGDEIRDEFKKILVKYCFIDTIPNNISELQTYNKITSEIEEFQNFLKGVKIFPNNFSILEYISDIDVLFAKKSSQHFLDTARQIMLKDLSSTMSIGVETIPEVMTKFKNIPLEKNEEETIRILQEVIPNSLFYFPRCMISKSAQEILDLVHIIMEQAVQCSDVVCKKLYKTSRLIFELYDAVVPYHHENYLQTIPQYVALFHNNCMYLAHNLQTLGDKWLILMEGREPNYAISFVDLVQKLRDLGYKHLTLHLQQQRKQILDNIRSSDLNSMMVKDVLSDNAEAAVRQCLRQLQLLKNVWIGVFPPNVFTRLMATLVTMLTSELVHRVVTVEDISMEIAQQLSDMYHIVVQKAPLLFLNPKDIEHVETWIKLQELIFVVGGSLKDIEAHWDEGKGPLAQHFRTHEIRTLIKALFQNTQIRANLLSKIK